MGETTYGVIAFCILVLSFLLAIVVIASFRKDRITVLGGYLAIKLFVIYSVGSLWLMPWLYENYDLHWQSDANIVAIISYLILQIALSGIVAYTFRDLLSGAFRTPRLLFLLDISQWIIFATINYFVYQEDPFVLFTYDVIWFCAYPVFMLFLGIIRNKKMLVN